MAKKHMLRPVEHVQITAVLTVDQLVKKMASSGAFGAGRLSEAVDVFTEMVKDREMTKFLGFAGAMVPAGMKQLIVKLIRDEWIDVVVTTGGNLVHDLVEAFGGRHYKGTCFADDTKLRADKINRIYDVFLPDSYFVLFEKKIHRIFDEIKKRELSIRELLTEIGKRLKDSNSILKAAADCDVPIFCPALSDSIIGLQLWLYTQEKKLKVDAFRDMHELIEICYAAKRAGGIFLGGGVPKNFILQAMLVTPKGGYDCAVQITMDRAETGGLSGATLEEAISWGKIKARAKRVTVIGDATLIFPIIVAAVNERLSIVH